MQTFKYIFLLLYMGYAFFIGIGGCYMAIWFSYKWVVEHRKDWQKINVTLNEIIPAERTVKGKPEKFLELTYNYKVDGVLYKGYSIYKPDTNEFIADEIEKVKRERNSFVIYYDRNNPEDSIDSLPDDKDPIHGNLASGVFLELIFLFLAWGGFRTFKKNYVVNFGKKAGSGTAASN